MQSSETSKKPRPKGLVVVLSALSAKQLKLFRKYLEFEPFNAMPRLLELFLRIESKILKPEKLHLPLENLLPGSGIPANQLSKLVTLLHQKLDLFLSLQQIQNAPHRHLPFTLHAYQELGIESGLSEKKWRQLHKKLNTGPQTEEHFFQRYYLAQVATQIRIGPAPRTTKSHFQHIHDLSDLAYVTAKMRYLCASINEASILNLAPPIAQVEALAPLISQCHDEFPPYSEAFHLVLKLLSASAPPPSDFEKLLDFLRHHGPAIHQGDLFDLYNYVLNVIYSRIDIGEKAFVELAASTYSSMLAHGLLTLNGEMHPRIFKNIVSINCKLQRFAWCGTFIKDHQHFLKGENALLLPRYCSGLIQFYAGDHFASAEAFRQIMLEDPDDYYWGFESRNLLLKSLFHRFEELSFEEHEELLRLVESFRMYIRRNSRLSEFHKQSYLNFIRYFTAILKFKDQAPSEDALESLAQEIQDQQFVTHKAWLMARLREK